MIGKIFIGVIALFLLIGPFASPISQGIHTWRTYDQTDNFAGVETGVGVTSANVTLSGDLFQASTDEVQSISSTIEESPVALTYVEATQVLEVSGLSANQTRTLSVAYYAETEDVVMRAIGPFLPILIFGACAGAIIWGMFFIKGRRSKGW